MPTDISGTTATLTLAIFSTTGSGMCIAPRSISSVRYAGCVELGTQPSGTTITATTTSTIVRQSMLTATADYGTAGILTRLRHSSGIGRLTTVEA